MSIVKGSELRLEPKLFATTRIGREVAAAEEIENAFLGLGIEVLTEAYERRGIVIVKAPKEADPLELVGILRSRAPSRVYWCLPINMVVETSYENIARGCTELVLLSKFAKPFRLICICRKRGNYIDSCSRLTRVVGDQLEKLGLAEVDFRAYEYVLRIEILDRYSYLSLYKRSEEPLFRFKTQTF